MNKRTISLAILMCAMFTFFSCESSDDISESMDHSVPECKSLTLTYGTQNLKIDDAILPEYFWGFVPSNNLEVVSLPTITVDKGATFTMSMKISDNVALKSLQLAYDKWLVSDYINFANPTGNTPLTPKSYDYSVQIKVPDDAVTTPWIEDYYYKDGLQMKVTQPYHKITLTLTDVNMNERIIPIFVKVQ